MVFNHFIVKHKLLKKIIMSKLLKISIFADKKGCEYRTQQFEIKADTERQITTTSGNRINKNMLVVHTEQLRQSYNYIRFTCYCYEKDKEKTKEILLKRIVSEYDKMKSEFEIVGNHITKACN